MGEHFRDPDPLETILWLLSLIVVALVVIVVSVGVSTDKPIVAGVIPIACLSVSFFWKRAILSGPTLLQMVIAGIQEGMTWGGAISIVVLLILFVL